LPAIPPAAVQEKQTEPRQLAGGDEDVLVAVAGAAVDRHAVHGRVIAPVPVLQADRVGHATFEQLLDRLAGDLRER
jgi:hypothetical protein